MPAADPRMPMAVPPRSSTRLSLVAWTGALVFASSLLWFLYCYGIGFGVAAPEGPVLEPLLVNAALFSLFALHHSVLARPAVKAAIGRRLPIGLERSLYTWVASLLFIAVCGLWQPVPGRLYALTGGWALVGYSLQLAGIVLTLRGASAVDCLELAGVRPVLLAARGSAQSHVPLATSGLYGFVRHPLYFAWVLLVFGTPVMTATRASFAIISTLYLAAAIPWEERSLVEAFGQEYEEYRRKVRWRMMPGVY
jgi:protein-S-isoprenylcysteine O-methyltransferase Ste14